MKSYSDDDPFDVIDSVVEDERCMSELSWRELWLRRSPLRVPHEDVARVREVYGDSVHYTVQNLMRHILDAMRFDGEVRRRLSQPASRDDVVARAMRVAREYATAVAECLRGRDDTPGLDSAMYLAFDAEFLNGGA